MSYYTLYLIFRFMVIIMMAAAIGFAALGIFLGKKDRVTPSMIAMTLCTVCICLGLISFGMGLQAGKKNTQMTSTWNDAKPVCIITNGTFPDKLTSVSVYVRDKKKELHLKKFECSGTDGKTDTYAFTGKNNRWTGTQETITYSDTLETGVTWVLPKKAVVEENSDLAKRTSDEYLTQIAEEHIAEENE